MHSASELPLSQDSHSINGQKVSLYQGVVAAIKQPPPPPLVEEDSPDDPKPLGSTITPLAMPSASP